MEKQQTIDLLRCGDSKAWEDIVLEYQAPLSRYLYNMVRDKELARDLTQDTFMEAYRGISKTEGELKLKSWLYRIATNTAYDHLRRRKLIHWLPLLDDDRESSVERSPEGLVGDRQAVQLALLELPAKYRVPLVLFCVEGYSTREIAAMIEISEGAVKTRLYRARERFREAYGGGRAR